MDQIHRPLIVDVDGTLLATDSLHEYIAAALPHPWLVVAAGFRLLARGRAGFKRFLAERVDLDVDLLPVNEVVVGLIRERSAAGDPVLLATGADSALAAKLLLRFEVLEGYFASDGVTNLTSTRKADRLVAEFGDGGFDYVGNSRADLAVWRRAAGAYLLSDSSATPSWSRTIAFDSVLHASKPPAWRAWAKELRVHQTLKNLLLFLPLVAAHQLGQPVEILRVLAGFALFSFAAFAVYLVNDILDLRSDRLHPSKSRRPIAAGRISALRGLLASGGFIVVAIVGAAFLDPSFAVVLAGYAVLTCLYSFWLKKIILVDVIILALLYMVRILAGAVLTAVPLSFWFTSVTLFLFISLALAKRYTELRRSAAAEPVPGRGYSGIDATVVLALGIAVGVSVLLLLASYIQSDAVSALYPSSPVLWLAIPTIFYWIGHLWLQAGRGTMHDDPVIFALRDRSSVISAGVALIIFIIASTHVIDLVQTVMHL